MAPQPSLADTNEAPPLRGTRDAHARNADVVRTELGRPLRRRSIDTALPSSRGRQDGADELAAQIAPLGEEEDRGGQAQDLLVKDTLTVWSGF